VGTTDWLTYGGEDIMLQGAATPIRVNEGTGFIEVWLVARVEVSVVCA
jgi:hypothetical protein